MPLVEAGRPVVASWPEANLMPMLPGSNSWGLLLSATFHPRGSERPCPGHWNSRRSTRRRISWWPRCRYCSLPGSTCPCQSLAVLRDRKADPKGSHIALGIEDPAVPRHRENDGYAGRERGRGLEGSTAEIEGGTTGTLGQTRKSQQSAVEIVASCEPARWASIRLGRVGSSGLRETPRAGPAHVLVALTDK